MDLAYVELAAASLGSFPLSRMRAERIVSSESENNGPSLCLCLSACLSPLPVCLSAYLS